VATTREFAGFHATVQTAAEHAPAALVAAVRWAGSRLKAVGTPILDSRARLAEPGAFANVIVKVSVEDGSTTAGLPAAV